MQTFISKRSDIRNNVHETSTMTDPVTTTGMISELLYNEHQPWLAQQQLIPLLQQLGVQSRWQLWLTPPHRLSRHWLNEMGLPLHKVMQTSPTIAITTVEAMIKALGTGNYSVVLSWITDEISTDDKRNLEDAARSGQTLGLIMRQNRLKNVPLRPLNTLKIHSTLYH